MTATQRAILGTVSLGLVLALPAAWVYAWALVRSPVPHLGVLLAFALGALVGRSMTAIAARLGVRDRRTVLTLAVAITGVAYLVSWLPWLSMTLAAVHHPIPFALLVHPDVAANVLGLLYETGAWRIGASVIAGPTLACIWAGEVVVVLVSAALTAWSALMQNASGR